MLRLTDQDIAWMDALPFAVLVLGKDGLVMFANPAAEETLKPETGALVGLLRPQWIVTDREVVKVPDPSGDFRMARIWNISASWQGNPAVLVLLTRLLSTLDEAVTLKVKDEIDRVLSSLPDCIWTGIYEPDGKKRLLYISPVIFQISGLTYNDFEDDGHTLWQSIIHVDDQERFNQVNQDVLKNGEDYELEYRIVSATGTIRWVRDSVQVRQIESGKQRRDGIISDITDRKLTEQVLEEQRNLQRQILDLNPNMVFAKDRSGRFILANRAYADLLGFAVEDILGRTEAEIIPDPDMTREYQRDDESVISTMSEVVRVEKISRKHGRMVWVQMTKRPLVDNDGQVIGVLGVGTDITERKNVEEELRTANEKLTRWVSDLEQRNQESLLLNEMGDLFQNCKDYQEIYHVVEQYSQQLFSDQVGGMYIYDEDTNLMERQACWGLPPPCPEHVFGLEDCWALRRGQPFVSTGSNRGLRCKHLGAQGPSKHLRASICVPMIAQSKPLGMLNLEVADPEDVDRWKPLMLMVAERVSLALANLRLSDTLRSQSIRDPLTNLFNRRYMEETFERELHRAARHNRPLGVVLFDIDHFKKFNDTYGHEAGDAILRAIGDFLLRQTRSDDVICRYGGEEFALIILEAKPEDTLKRAEALCTGIHRLEVTHMNQVMEPVSISAGAASFPIHGRRSDDLLRAADKALYEAKRQGRNQVVMASEEV
ncbi:MAG: diguanylate cyclase [Anaerolineae bacterium]|nr:diguanylate cyclase [Anaerolineae bacterium]